jgi:hypothetical protein
LRYERTDHFKTDYRRLDPGEREMFRVAVREMNQSAGDQQDPRRVVWPARLRIKGVQSAPGVWEMTWSFSRPDGRATFEFVRIEDSLGVRWRRIGGHYIFKEP